MANIVTRIISARRFLWALLAGMLLVLLLFLGADVAHAGKKKKADQPAIAPELVWPLPPDKPRIRYVMTIGGSEDVEPPKKSNFLQRLGRVEVKKTTSKFTKPYGVTTDSRDRIFVSDTRQHEVFVFDREKKKVDYVGKLNQLTFRTPVGMTVDHKDRLWVADSAGRRVYAFHPTLGLAAMIGTHDEFESPTAVAVDGARNRLYVVDTKKHAVLVFDAETGKFIRQIGQRGPNKGEFNFPTNIVLDKAGRFYVVDTMSARVQVFNSNYKFVETWGSRGDSLGQFARPKGIALDRFGNVYIVDALFSNVQIFDPKRRLLMFFGGIGDKPGRFSLPTTVHVDGNDLIYVVDQDNRRVQIFKLLDGTVEEPPTPGKRAEVAQKEGR